MCSADNVIADEIPRIVWRDERPVFITQAALMASQRVDDLRSRRSLVGKSLRRLAVDEPVLRRFSEIVAAQLPVLVDERRPVREIVGQIMRCRIWVFNNEPQTARIEHRKHLQSHLIVVLSHLAPLDDLLDLVLHRLVFPVKVGAVEKRGIMLTEIHAREKRQSDVVITDGVDDACIAVVCVLYLCKQVNDVVSLAEIVLHVVVQRLETEFDELVLERPALFEIAMNFSFYVHTFLISDTIP